MSFLSKIPVAVVNPQDRNAWIWGLTPQAEIWNGRAAMLGFFAAFIVELVFL